MNKKVTGLAGAVGLAGFGTLVLVGYVQAAEDRALAGERLVPVLVAQEEIERGTPASELGSMVVTEQVPAKVRAAGAVSDLGDLADQAAIVDLLPGEQLVASRFGEASVVGGADVPDGLEELTVSLETHRAGGGRIQPGSRVGVFASYDETAAGPARTEVVLRDVPVLAVQGGPGADEEESGEVEPGSTVLVTLAVEPAAVERVVYGAEHGRIWLSGTEGTGGQEAAL